MQLYGTFQVMLVLENPTANASDRGDVGSIPSWEDPLEEGMATHSSSLAWRILPQRSLAGCSPWGQKELDTTEVT